MATISFYGRGDSNTANNAALNAQNTNSVPTTELIFSSGTDGDLILDANGGAADPDTTVIIDGVEMTFTVNFSGTLPHTNKLANVNGEDLRGEPIVVITAEDGGRYFFLPNGVSQATMDAFPNGAHDLEAVVDDVDVPVCFVGGTMIRTPAGDVPVETLRPGNLVSSVDGRKLRLLWMAKRQMTFAELLLEPQFRPVCLPMDLLGKGYPDQDLWLSPQHRFLFSGWQAELLFRNAEVFLPAASCHDLPGVPTPDVAAGVGYYHLMFNRHEVIFANNLPCESLFPGDSAIASLSENARIDLNNRFPQYKSDWIGYGPTARQALTRREGELLLSYAGIGQTEVIANRAKHDVRAA